MVAGRFGVFLNFDEATVAKHRLDVARVKFKTVRREMIDTVLQLRVQGIAYDVWVDGGGKVLLWGGDEVSPLPLPLPLPMS
jgi:hypothetical protein